MTNQRSLSTWAAKSFASMLACLTVALLLVCATAATAQTSVTTYIYTRTAFDDLRLPADVMLVDAASGKALSAADAGGMDVTLSADGEYIVSSVADNDCWQMSERGGELYLRSVAKQSYLYLSRSTLKLSSADATPFIWDASTGCLKLASSSQYLRWSGSRWTVELKSNATPITFYLRTATTYQTPDFSVHDVVCRDITAFVPPTLLNADVASSIVYSSSNPLVATVGHDGRVNLLRNGRTEITAEVTAQGVLTTVSYTLTVQDFARLCESVDVLTAKDLLSDGYKIDFRSPLTGATYVGAASRIYNDGTFAIGQDGVVGGNSARLVMLSVVCNASQGSATDILLYTGMSDADAGWGSPVATVTLTGSDETTVYDCGGEALYTHFRLASSALVGFGSITVVWRDETVAGNVISTPTADERSAAYDLSGRRIRHAAGSTPRAARLEIVNRRKIIQ